MRLRARCSGVFAKWLVMAAMERYIPEQLLQTKRYSKTPPLAMIDSALAVGVPHSSVWPTPQLGHKRARSRMGSSASSDAPTRAASVDAGHVVSLARGLSPKC